MARGAGAGGVVSHATPDTGYVRRIQGLEVIDENGNPVEQPFLGGFNIPRPQLVDIDADGDHDLFLQEWSGSVMFFEHVAGATPRYQWRADRYQDLEVGEWYRFVDLDRDGDADLLAERPFSYLRYYRNDGTPQDAIFVAAADTLRDTDGRAIFSDRQNIPNATDIDCDGQMDLLIGRLEGTVTRYEETGTDENGIPRFRHLTDAFEGIKIVAQIGSAHGANTMARVTSTVTETKTCFGGTTSNQAYSSSRTQAPAGHRHYGVSRCRSRLQSRSGPAATTPQPWEMSTATAMMTFS